MTDDEVKGLARDLVMNKVFMSDQCRIAEDIPMVFPILSFLKKEDIDGMVERKVAYLYEYNDKATPGRSVNGYPIFFSCRTLTQEDYQRVRAEEKKMREAIGDIPAKRQEE